MFRSFRQVGMCFGPMLSALLVPGMRAQSATTADTVYHLHGSVVNGVTGRPIGRALVVSQDRRLATMTDSEGQFALDVSVPAAVAAATQGQPGVASGSTLNPGAPNGSGLVLLAQRPGYLRSRRGTTVALDSGTATNNIVLRLLPSASVHGEIAATGAEGVRGLRVELLRHAMQDGRPSWQMATVRMVGADRSFQMSDLQPGEYTIVTTEWSPRPLSAVAATSTTEQYPPDFLGDARTLDSATKLHLGYGQTAQANLHLRAVPYYPITIPVQGLPPNSGAIVRVSGGAGFQLYELGWNNRDGAVEGALPDGDYTIIVEAPGSVQSAAHIPLHVAGAAVVHAPAGLTPTQDIPVDVRDERTHSNGSGGASLAGSSGGSTTVRTPGFFLSIRPADPDSGGGGMMQNTAGEPVLQNMLAGRYYLQANAFGNGYIAAMTCDGVNLLTDAFVVNESGHTAPVVVTLRDDGGTISGKVDFRNSGLQTARVLVLPTDGSGHVLYGFVNTSGTFQIGNVPPGSYRVFALPPDQIDTLPYQDAQAMRAYDGRGGTVSVAAGQTAQVQAELVGLDGAEVQP